MGRNRKHIRVTYSTLGSPDPLLDQYYEEDELIYQTSGDDPIQKLEEEKV